RRTPQNGNAIRSPVTHAAPTALPSQRVTAPTPTRPHTLVVCVADPGGSIAPPLGNFDHATGHDRIASSKSTFSTGNIARLSVSHARPDCESTHKRPRNCALNTNAPRSPNPAGRAQLARTVDRSFREAPMSSASSPRRAPVPDAIAALHGGLVVSCQAGDQTNPLYGPETMALMARAAEIGGAVALRVNGPDDTRAVMAATSLPVLAINKVDYPDSDVRITPTVADTIAI